jgi:hypothetical protein
MGLPGATVIHQRQALPLTILEFERQSPVLHGRRPVLHSELIESLGPVVKSVRPIDPQSRSRDRASAAPFPRHGPVEEGDICSRASERIRVEQVVGGHVILVHAALDQSHSQRLGEEPLVLPNLCGNRGEMVYPKKIHRKAPFRLVLEPDAAMVGPSREIPQTPRSAVLAILPKSRSVSETHLE